jgi:CO dehydrogenase/acetyl-CoA synthase epsilon subunit
MSKFKIEVLGIIENMSENLDSDGEITESVKIKNEFDDEILFSLPRLSRKDFYQELKVLDKLKRYLPKRILQI